MKEELLEEAVSFAKEARDMAHAPYSKFKVGAAVVTKSGKIFTGCNVENASYGLTVCAERVAIFKAVSEGEKDIDFVVVVTDTNPPSAPCGACRQVIREFGKEIKVVMTNLNGDIIIKSLSELLPLSFGPEDLI